MWKCSICKKSKVGNDGFRVFIDYTLGIKQIRICDECLKKKGQDLEIKLLM